MTYKRQLWTSGFEYRVRCPFCGTHISYTDRQLGFRPWYTDGFVYCPRCKHPIRHTELFAVHPDGTPVYRTEGEAQAAVREGYYKAFGVSPEPEGGAQSPPGYVPAVAYCTKCGRQYRKGYDKFCSGCGEKFE